MNYYAISLHNAIYRRKTIADIAKYLHNVPVSDHPSISFHRIRELVKTWL